MQRLFTAIDSIRPSALQPHKHVVLPVMFRLIYTCGLRPAEARVLPANNVYLDSGEILITETKRSRDRMIVMSEDMRTLCADYNEQRKVLFPDSPFFFPGTDGKAFASATVSREFCKCWAKANPDVPKENLPDVRVYDLRHRFASAAVQRWLDEGADLNAKLPFLRAYMGHASFSQTAYYIHLLPANLTASNAVDWSAFDALIPEVRTDAKDRKCSAYDDSRFLPDLPAKPAKVQSAYNTSLPNSGGAARGLRIQAAALQANCDNI